MYRSNNSDAYEAIQRSEFELTGRVHRPARPGTYDAATKAANRAYTARRDIETAIELNFEVAEALEIMNRMYERATSRQREYIERIEVNLVDTVAAYTRGFLGTSTSVTVIRQEYR